MSDTYGFDRSFDALTELLRDISDTDTVIPALSTAPFAAPVGQIYVGGELINYTSLGQGPVGERIFNVVRDPAIARPHRGGEPIWQQRHGLLVGGVLAPPRAITEYEGFSLEELPNLGKNKLSRYGTIYEEFCGGSFVNGSANAGENGWFNGGTNNGLQQAPSANHNGVARLFYSAIAGSLSYLHMGSAGPFLASNIVLYDALFKIDGSIQGGNVFFTDSAATFANSFGFSWGSTFFASSVVDGSQTSIGTGITAFVGVWYRLRMEYVGYVMLFTLSYKDIASNTEITLWKGTGPMVPSVGVVPIFRTYNTSGTTIQGLQVDYMSITLDTNRF